MIMDDGPVVVRRTNVFLHSILHNLKLPRMNPIDYNSGCVGFVIREHGSHVLLFHYSTGELNAHTHVFCGFFFVVVVAVVRFTFLWITFIHDTQCLSRRCCLLLTNAYAHRSRQRNVWRFKDEHENFIEKNRTFWGARARVCCVWVWTAWCIPRYSVSCSRMNATSALHFTLSTGKCLNEIKMGRNLFLLKTWFELIPANTATSSCLNSNESTYLSEKSVALYHVCGSKRLRMGHVERRCLRQLMGVWCHFMMECIVALTRTCTLSGMHRPVAGHKCRRRGIFKCSLPLTRITALDAIIAQLKPETTRFFSSFRSVFDSRKC